MRRSSKEPLSLGKLPISVLNETVLRMTGAPSDRITTPPLAGVDFAAVKIDGKYLVISADPITGVVDDIGSYAVNVSANDVATSGNRPQFAESVILLPDPTSVGDVEALARDVDRTAREIGLSIVGGHTEVTPGLRRPIVVVTVFSIVKGYISSADALSGDTIMMTKSAGLEGTAILGPSPEVKEKFRSQLSVIDEAVAAYRSGKVHAMHDCTEGGVLGAVYEMSAASGLGFKLRGKAVPVAPETERLCRELAVDPLKLIGSGALLLAVEPGGEEEVRKALGGDSSVVAVGKFEEEGRMLLGRDGKKRNVVEAPEDELWRVLGRRG